MDGTRRVSGWWARPVLVGTALLLGASCLKLPKEEGRKREGQKVTVVLPPRPNLTATKTPERLPDGAFSVEGFLRRAKEIPADESGRRRATVRGFVHKVVRCPEGSRLCPTVPHLVLVDNPTVPRGRLVVVSDPENLVLEGFPEGSQQTLQGEVALWSPDGRLVDLRGLLVIRKEPAPKAGDSPAKVP